MYENVDIEKTKIRNLCNYKDYLCNYTLFGFVKLASDFCQQLQNCAGKSMPSLVSLSAPVLEISHQDSGLGREGGGGRYRPPNETRVREPYDT